MGKPSPIVLAVGGSTTPIAPGVSPMPAPGQMPKALEMGFRRLPPTSPEVAGWEREVERVIDYIRTASANKSVRRALLAFPVSDILENQDPAKVRRVLKLMQKHTPDQYKFISSTWLSKADIAWVVRKVAADIRTAELEKQQEGAKLRADVKAARRGATKSSQS